MDRFPRLSSDQQLLRTLLNKSWVVDNKPHYSAFQPRKDDKDGISLFFNKQEAGEEFERPIFGFLTVHTGSVREISIDEETTLEIIQDRDEHALIVGIPNFQLLPKDNPDRKSLKKQANLLALEIAEKASEIEEYVPEGFSPLDLLED